MPYFKMICFYKHKDGSGTYCRRKVANKHDLFLIPSVAERSRKDAHYYIGRIGTDGKQGGL